MVTKCLCITWKLCFLRVFLLNATSTLLSSLPSFLIVTYKCNYSSTKGISPELHHPIRILPNALPEPDIHRILAVEGVVIYCIVEFPRNSNRDWCRI